MTTDPEISAAIQAAKKAKAKAMKSLFRHLALMSLPVAFAYCAKLSGEAGMFGPTILFAIASLAGCYLLGRYGDG